MWLRTRTLDTRRQDTEVEHLWSKCDGGDVKISSYSCREGGKTRHVAETRIPIKEFRKIARHFLGGESL